MILSEDELKVLLAQKDMAQKGVAMDAQKIGKLVNELRTRKNLTQKELADMVNVTDKAVSKWERGECCPDVSVLPNLAKALGASVEGLMNGEMPAAGGSPQRKVAPYDFARPTFLGKYQMRALCDAGVKFADVVAEKLFAMVGERLRLRVSSVDELSNAEFSRSVPSRTFIYDFDYNNGGFCLELDPQIGKALLKQDLARHQELTSLDAEMLGCFFAPQISAALLEVFYERTNKSVPFAEFELKKTETLANPALVPYQHPNDVCGLIRVECKAECAEGFMNVQLSRGFIAKLSGLDFFGMKGASPVFQRLQSIKDKPLAPNTFVEFGRFNPENVALEKGRILVFGKRKTEGLDIVYKNRIIHTGEAVAVDENFGVRICEDKLESETVYDEAEYLSVELGATNLDDEGAARLRAGSVLELNTLAGQALPIVKSGHTVAEGEIVIAGENFAIRVKNVRQS